MLGLGRFGFNLGGYVPPAAGGGGGAWSPETASVAASMAFVAATSSAFTNQAGTTNAADTNTVQCIRDRANNRIAFQTGGTYPTYAANGGKPAIVFTGGQTLLGTGAQTYNFTDASRNGTFGCAIKTLGNSGEIFVEAGHKWAKIFASGPPGPLVCTMVSGGVDQGSDWAGVNAAASTIYTLIARVKTSGEIEFWVNGVSNGADTIAPSVPDTVLASVLTRLGDPGGNGHWLYAMSAHPGLLTDTEIVNSFHPWLLAQTA